MWNEIYEKVSKIVADGADILFFRGHSDASWSLLPGLGRDRKIDINDVERIIYYDFVTRAGALLPEANSSWNNLFAMQHHGMPTRLLDWTESFSVALYFALKNARGTACVWILDPFDLNMASVMDNSLLHVTDFSGNYEEYFLLDKQEFTGDVVAISPLRHHPRVFGQKGGFTLHSNLGQPLDALYPSQLTKIEIPVLAHEAARRYLKLAGISEFSLFPDLDGLSREMKLEHFGRD